MGVRFFLLMYTPLKILIWVNFWLSFSLNSFINHINNTFIGQSHTPFIIAEISGNHNQSLNRALEIIDAASDAGAHAVKIQTYTADTMTLDIKDKEFFIKDKNSLWYGKSLYELYKIAYTPWEWHEEIFDYANKLGLICFSTPFDETAIDFLENLNVPAYKIASFENSHIKLLPTLLLRS